MHGQVVAPGAVSCRSSRCWRGRSSRCRRCRSSWRWCGRSAPVISRRVGLAPLAVHGLVGRDRANHGRALCGTSPLTHRTTPPYVWAWRDGLLVVQLYNDARARGPAEQRLLSAPLYIEGLDVWGGLVGRRADRELVGGLGCLCMAGSRAERGTSLRTRDKAATGSPTRRGQSPASIQSSHAHTNPSPARQGQASQEEATSKDTMAI